MSRHMDGNLVSLLPAFGATDISFTTPTLRCSLNSSSHCTSPIIQTDEPTENTNVFYGTEKPKSKKTILMFISHYIDL